MAADPDRGEFEVVNELGIVAVASWHADEGCLDVVVTTARSFGVGRVDAVRLLIDLRSLARASGCDRLRLQVNDPVVRTAARVQGFAAALRADLVRDTASWDGEITPAWPVLDRAAVETALNQLLPDALVTIDAGNPLVRLARRSETGMPGCVRLVATRDGRSVQVVAPLGPAVMVESLAAALDTLLSIFERFAAVARQIPPVVFGMAALEMVEGHVSGQAGGGRITINPAHVTATAVEMLMARYVTAELGRPVASAYRASSRPFGAALGVDKVVAHEVGHCVDGLSGNGRIADTAEFRTRIGRALGVDSVELALRGRDAGAPDEWRRAYLALVEQISDYATTSGVELFAEIFAAWWQRRDVPVVTAFDGLMNARFPAPNDDA